MKMILHIIIVFSAGFISSCQESCIKSIPDYLSYLENRNNGLTQERIVNGIKLKVKYLPSEYLAYREIETSNLLSPNSDSILSQYKNSVCILLSFDPSEELGQDVMFRDVIDEKGFSERVLAMNFGMEEAVILRAGAKEYKPVLSTMENVYGLKPGRNILLVFVPDSGTEKELFESTELRIEYDDFLFAMGKNMFVFKREDIKKIPTYNFWKTRS